MATFVIVHGGWSGAWEWRAFAPLLQAAGHEVLRTTLTGFGERSHLASPAIGLDTHIQDVVNVLVYEDLRGVLLVGHSYGGAVVTGAAERVPERLAHLVYVDAFVPEDGQTVAELLGPEVAADWRERVRTLGDGWRLPSPFGGATERNAPAPWRPMEQPLAVQNPAAAVLPRTYIHCTGKANPDAPVYAHFRETAARARARGWRLRELPTGHLPMRSAPRELADLLLGVPAAVAEHER
ncbi:MAG TPA: alpha/beta hydrolase family protein [Chloroflexota bacterium]|nr:alpha/beta hydrolase family protein [Chloroflexota bacterium]